MGEHNLFSVSKILIGLLYVTDEQKIPLPFGNNQWNFVVCFQNVILYRYGTILEYMHARVGLGHICHESVG